jgi:hypothetical protein
MKSLIIGKGQVGSGLYEVIKDYHETYIKDVEDLELEGVEILHLCFPNSDKFIELANAYIAKYQPKLTINHASVPVGTTENLSGLKCYSPVRGKHPRLAGDIKIFEKFIAGDYEACQMASDYFKKCGLSVVLYDEKEKIRTLEFCKLMSNIRYGYEICFMQEAERIAKELKVDIETFSAFEESYNKGYRLLGQHNMIRPILFGGSIGGHCVLQNAEIIRGQYPSQMIDWMFFSDAVKKLDIKKETNNDPV